MSGKWWSFCPGLNVSTRWQLECFFLNYSLLPDGTKPLDSNKPLPLAPELMFNFSSGKLSGIYLQGNNFTGSAQATNLFNESET